MLPVTSVGRRFCGRAEHVCVLILPLFPVTICDGEMEASKCLSCFRHCNLILWNLRQKSHNFISFSVKKLVYPSALCLLQFGFKLSRFRHCPACIITALVISGNRHYLFGLGGRQCLHLRSDIKRHMPEKGEARKARYLQSSLTSRDYYCQEWRK